MLLSMTSFFVCRAMPCTLFLVDTFSNYPLSFCSLPLEKSYLLGSPLRSTHSYPPFHLRGFVPCNAASEDSSEDIYNFLASCLLKPLIVQSNFQLFKLN